MAEITDRELEILAAELGLDLDAPDPVTAEQLERVRRAGHRIGEGYRPFPGACNHFHRLEAL